MVYLLAISGYLGYQGYVQAVPPITSWRDAANPVRHGALLRGDLHQHLRHRRLRRRRRQLGMGMVWLAFLTIAVGVFTAFVVMGNPTRRMGHHLDAHTFPELMGKRFNSRFIHVMCASSSSSASPLRSTPWR